MAVLTTEQRRLISSHIRRHAPVFVRREFGPSRRVDGAFDSVDRDARGFACVVIYLERGLGAHDEHIASIVRAVRSGQANSHIEYPVHLLTFGWEDGVPRRAGIRRTGSQLANVSAWKQDLRAAAGTEPGNGWAPISDLLPPLGQRCGKDKLSRTDLAVFICSSRSVSLSAEAHQLYEASIGRHAIWVFLVPEGVEVEAGGYGPPIFAEPPAEEPAPLATNTGAATTVQEEVVVRSCTEPGDILGSALPQKGAAEMPTCRNVVEDLVHLDREVCRRLWHTVGEGSPPEAISPHVIYPDGHMGGLRVSEQEARFAFTELLTTSPYYYSAETPTREGYQFTGQTGKAAHTDLSLFVPKPDGLTRVANIEFKQANAPATAIGHDIEKLVREATARPDQPLVGNYFQLLQAADWKTIDALLKKLRDAFAAVATTKWVPGPVSIVFCFCVLSKTASGTAWACIKRFDYAPGATGIAHYANEHLALPSQRPTRPPRESLRVATRSALQEAGWELVLT